MAYTTINKSSDHFNTKLYTGNGSYGNSITGVGFQPDLIWIKNRSTTHSHRITDAVRGTDKCLSSDNTSSELSSVNLVHSFDSDGFTVDDDSALNGNGNNIVSWNWKANGSGSTNYDGTINSTVSVNTTAGFSIVSYTGNATAGATVGHGLGVTPDLIIVKVRNQTNNWAVYHKSMGETKAMYIDGTSAETTDAWLNNTAPTSSVFTLSGGNYGNTNGNTHIAYCFAEKPGYSKFGSYTGNGSTDGTFVQTGFAPSLVVYKNASQTDEWFVKDNKRPGYNPTDLLFWSAANAEVTNLDRMDIFSNGFKATTTDKGANVNGNKYIYLAFGQSLVGSNNVPCTAR